MARTDRTPRRRLDADARREVILDAAAAIFRAAPYAAVRISDVAEAAGSSPALVYRYFASKAHLYAAVIERAGEVLHSREAAALEAIASGSPVRDRVRTLLEAYLDHVAADPTSWTNPFLAGDEPPEALAVRASARQRSAERLRSELSLTGAWARHEYALLGYVGFVDQACLAWAREGCPAELRWAVVESSLGALEGALGDWRTR